MSFMCRNAILLFLILGCSSCSLFESLGIDSGKKGLRLSEIVGNANRKVVSQQIDRETFTRSVEESGALGSIRLVAVYSASSDKYPEYRIFGVQKDGPYYILGLRNGDILRAANDYLLFDETKFPPYVSLLRYANKGQIDIYRKGEAILFEYTFMPQRSSTNLPGGPE